MKDQQIKLTLTEDGDYQKLWFSPEVNHGDWNHFFVVKMEYTDEWGDGIDYKLHFSVCVVSPEAVSKEGISSACQCSDIDEEVWRGMTNITRSQVLMQYGTYATLWQKGGNNERKLFKEAREKLQEIDMLFGFKMDCHQNACGNSGWDFVTGDIGFKRKEKDDVEDQTERDSPLQSGDVPPEHKQPEAADGEHLAEQEVPGGDRHGLPLHGDHENPA